MKTVIGICGTTASGKDTVGAYIAEKLKIPIFECSKPVIEETKRRGLPLIRTEIMKVGSELAAKIGPGFPVAEFLSKIKKIGIITGLRAPINIDYLRKNSRLILIAVDADPKIRFERAKERKREIMKEARNIEEFLSYEAKEIATGELNVFKCMSMADYKIENNSNLEELQKKTDKILAKERLN